MTRSEWVKQIHYAWDDEICPSCGRCHGVDRIDADGTVWTHCARYGRSHAIAQEDPPDHFDPEPNDDDDLPW